MVIDNTLHNRQSQPGTAGATGAIATHKRLEQMLALFRQSGPSSSTWNQALLASLPLLTLIQPLP